VASYQAEWTIPALQVLGTVKVHLKWLSKPTAPQNVDDAEQRGQPARLSQRPPQMPDMPGNSGPSIRYVHVPCFWMMHVAAKDWVARVARPAKREERRLRDLMVLAVGEDAAVSGTCAS